LTDREECGNAMEIKEEENDQMIKRVRVRKVKKIEKR
jgi:hypothetical protein